MRGFPHDLGVLELIDPVYRSFDGWDDLEHGRLQKVLSGGFARLPKNMRDYIRFVEKETGVRVELLGLGRRRSELLDLRKRRW